MHSQSWLSPLPKGRPEGTEDQLSSHYSPLPNISNAPNKTNTGPNSQKLIKLTYLIETNRGTVSKKLIKLTC